MSRKEILASIKQGKPLSLKTSSASHTTRSKSYNNDKIALDISGLNQILKIDPEEKCVHVEPRVSMEQLVRATLRYGLIPPVVPEFKGITVGGAIMGAAAESSSHQWGLFSDTCIAYELVLGDGTLLEITEKDPLFHAIPGSYGTLGLLLSTKIKLIAASPSIHLIYKAGIPQTSEAPFLDGIVFNKGFSITMEGYFSSEKAVKKGWYYTDAKENGEVIIPLTDYLFRFDPGAFWMGAYLLRLPFLRRFLTKSKSPFPQKARDAIFPLPTPPNFLLKFLSSKRLWKLQHGASDWVNNHLLIQDCCLPRSHAETFLHEAMKEVAVFPLWLCPIKKSTTSQLFAPHSLTDEVLNIGFYGLPNRAGTVDLPTKWLEKKTREYGGRKVLYSRSFYTQNDFWEIYDEGYYRELRQKTHSENAWPDITDKVLSA